MSAAARQRTRSPELHRVVARPEFVKDLRRIISPNAFARVTALLDRPNATFGEFQAAMSEVLGSVEFIQIGTAKKGERKPSPPEDAS